MSVFRRVTCAIVAVDAEVAAQQNSNMCAKPRAAFTTCSGKRQRPTVMPMPRMSANGTLSAHNSCQQWLAISLLLSVALARVTERERLSQIPCPMCLTGSGAPCTGG